MCLDVGENLSQKTDFYDQNINNFKTSKSGNIICAWKIAISIV